MKENRLWYTSPANNWYEAIPLGNGRLGMMVFGGISEDRIQLNEETFWTGWEFDGYDNPETPLHLDEIRKLLFEGKYVEAQDLCNKYLICRGNGSRDALSAFGTYQTAGDLYITTSHKNAEDYRRELTLDEGVSKVSYGSNKREYFVSYKYNTAIIRISGDIENIDLRYERENTTVIYSENKIFAVGCLPTKFTVLIRKKVVDDTMYVYITAATSYKTDLDPADVCRNTLDRAMGADYEDVLRENKEYFASFLNRAEIDLCGDEEKMNIPTDIRIADPEGDLGLVELYFNFGRYLLVGSSRGKLPANLQGIWCKDYIAPWNGDFHININLQMNYWFAEVCDLSEFLPPFFELIKYISRNGENTAKTMYNCPGWVAHYTTTAWGFTSPGMNPLYGAFATAGAWCLRHVKERWLYCGDIEILREFYPVIKGSSEFFCAYLVRDPRNGYLVTAPASSPENWYKDPKTGENINICAGPTMDTSIIRELFKFNIMAAKALDKDEEFVKELEDKLSQLMPLRIGKYGQIMEWPEEFEEVEPGHRHMSHLYGLYPSDEIKQSTPHLFEAAKKTIERRLSSGGGHTGWSRAWIINFYARLADGNSAYKNIIELLKQSTVSNMFDSHPVGKEFVFQIDGNFGGTAGICEMLLQSHDGCIDVLPALPDAWTDGEFKGFKARGGFTVSAKWENGKVVSCNVSGDEGKAFSLRVNGEKIEAQGSYIYKA